MTGTDPAALAVGVSRGGVVARHAAPAAAPDRPNEHPYYGAAFVREDDAH